MTQILYFSHPRRRLLHPLYCQLLCHLAKGRFGGFSPAEKTIIFKNNVLFLLVPSKLHLDTDLFSYCRAQSFLPATALCHLSLHRPSAVLSPLRGDHKFRKGFPADHFLLSVALSVDHSRVQRCSLPAAARRFKGITASSVLNVPATVLPSK